MLSNNIFAYKLISFTRGPKESVIAHLVFNFTTISRPARLVIFFIVLAHWNNSQRIEMSSHSDTWFRANQSLLFLLNAVCLAEKQQIPILVFGLTRTGLEPMIYHTQGEHANH
jgi:hypothetical protein